MRTASSVLSYRMIVRSTVASHRRRVTKLHPFGGRTFGPSLHQGDTPLSRSSRPPYALAGHSDNTDRCDRSGGCTVPYSAPARLDSTCSTAGDRGGVLAPSLTSTLPAAYLLGQPWPLSQQSKPLLSLPWIESDAGIQPLLPPRHQTPAQNFHKGLRPVINSSNPVTRTSTFRDGRATLTLSGRAFLSLKMRRSALDLQSSSLTSISRYAFSMVRRTLVMEIPADLGSTLPLTARRT